MTDQTLNGLQVLDLGQLYNAPYCALILSYMGAEVIKVEPPYGEPLRSRVDEGEPAEIVMLNSSKKGITLNLKKPRGKELFRQLAADSDVIVENYSTGTMEKLGLGYDSLSERNPELIYAHGSGFGEEGPYSDYPAMDLTIQAIGGVMDVTGFEDGPPVKTGVAVSDFLGGIHLASGILAALYERERTGLGQFVEVSMHDTVFPTMTSALASYYEDKDVPPRTGNRHSGLGHCPYNVYETADGYIAIFCVTNRHWKLLLEVLGREDLKQEERFSTNTKRTRSMEEIDDLIEGWTRQHSRDNIQAELNAKGVPNGPVNTVDEVANDPHLRERGMINELDHPHYDGPIGVPGLPIRLSDSDDPDIEPSPTKGQHNELVYAEKLDLSPEAIQQLDEQDVI